MASSLALACASPRAQPISPPVSSVAPRDPPAAPPVIARSTPAALHASTSPATCLDVDDFVATLGGNAPPPPRFRDLSAGGARTCGITRRGDVVCWGSGQLLPGDDDTSWRAKRIPRPAGFDPIEIEMGRSSGCLRGSDDRIACWGGAAIGKPLTGTTAYLVPHVSGVIDVSVDFGACAVTRRGEVWCWGDGSFRELDGRGLPTMPTQIPGIDDAVEVAITEHHGCIRRRSGRVTCWGNYNAPADLPGIEDAVALAVEGERACAVRANGGVTCWDHLLPTPDWRFGTHTPHGDPIRPPQPPPVTVMPVDGITQAVDVALGHDIGCVVTASGTVTCWGPGATLSSPAPGVVTSRVTALDDHACALANDGTGWCWGNDENRALGARRRLASTTPVPVCGVDDVAEIAAGDALTCVRTRAGELRCAGTNVEGQITTPTYAMSGAPRGTGRTGLDLTVALRHACAIDPDRRVVCWGRSEWGIGIPDLAAMIRWGKPDVAGSVEVAAGADRPCARLEDGRVVCWPAVAFGGVPGSNAASFPVAGVIAATQVVASPGGGCAREKTGKVVCWGNDFNEPAKPPKAWSTLLPEQRRQRVPPPETSPRELWSDAHQIAAGEGGACAILADGSVQCQARVPLAVPAPLQASRRDAPIDIAVGGGRACLLGAGGTVDCWTLRATPPVLARVPGLDDATELTMGVGHACALRRGGGPVCWGRDEHGQLGGGPEPRSDRAVRVEVVLP